LNAEKLTLSVEQAGKVLGISRALAYQMAHSGGLPILRFGKRMVVPRRALENMLQCAIGDPADNTSNAS
jgi:excisionase family DNA binding protein